MTDISSRKPDSPGGSAQDQGKRARPWIIAAAALVPVGALITMLWPTLAGSLIGLGAFFVAGLVLVVGLVRR